MMIEKNVGKKEGIARVVLGASLCALAVWVDGWLRWVIGLAGLAFIATAVVGT